MLTIHEIGKMCQRNKIDLSIVTTRNYAGDTPWNFHVTVEYEDESGTKVQHRRLGTDLDEAVNTAFAAIHRVAREGFKFPIMLEAPATSDDTGAPF